MKYSVNLISAVLIVYATACGPSPQNSQRPKTKQELQEELRLIECANLSDYLKFKIRREAVFKNKLSLKVTGFKFYITVSNSANVATWKDIKGTVNLLSKTKATIREYPFTVYEIIGPNDSKKKTIEVEVTSQQLRDFKDQGSFTFSNVRGVCVQ